MEDAKIGELAAADVPEAARMLARAFRDNPSATSMYGPDPLHRLSALHAGFSLLIPWYAAATIAAWSGGFILGAAGRGREGACLGSFIEQARGAPQPTDAADEWERITAWMFTWADHDPAEPHWHLGPIGVEPSFQGMGIGSAMLARFCEEVDRDGVIGWLETDKAQNVRLYERYGFKVVDETDILGVHNWWMRRNVKA